MSAAAPHSSAGTGRFAPSPSGPLHLGNLRTALAAWLYARSTGRRWLVRVDDLDPDRSSAAFAREQLADLEALGLGSDEPPVYQSQRHHLYDTALGELAAQGRTYPCFCTRADVREAATAEHGALPDGAYPGTCAQLSASTAEARIAAGEPHSIRVRAEGERASFEDGILGRVESVIDDFVVRRKDGVPAYNLAVVVDDNEQGVDQVVRGADLADGTPRQVWLAGVLGLASPWYAHVPLVLGPDGERLAKRHGAVSMGELAGAGMPPARVLSLLGSTLELCESDEQVTVHTLLERFRPTELPSDPVRLDPSALQPSA